MIPYIHDVGRSHYTDKTLVTPLDNRHYCNSRDYYNSTIATVDYYNSTIATVDYYNNRHYRNSEHYCNIATVDNTARH